MVLRPALGIRTKHDLNSSVQERQECHYETRCNGDLKLTAVFTTFGKVQKLEKGQPVRLVLTVQSEKRFSSLGTFGKSLRLVFSDFIQSNAVIFRTNCSTNVSVSKSENEK